MKKTYIIIGVVVILIIAYYFLIYKHPLALSKLYSSLGISSLPLTEETAQINTSFKH